MGLDLVSARWVTEKNGDFERRHFEVVYDVQHNNTTTTLSQQATFHYDPMSRQWTAVNIALVDFPSQASLPDAMMKLGEWLTRLGEALGTGENPEQSLPLRIP